MPLILLNLARAHLQQNYLIKNFNGTQEHH